MLQSENTGLFETTGLRNKIAQWIMGYPISGSYGCNPFIPLMTNIPRDVEVSKLTRSSFQLSRTSRQLLLKTDI